MSTSTLENPEFNNRNYKIVEPVVKYSIKGLLDEINKLKKEGKCTKELDKLLSTLV